MRTVSLDVAVRLYHLGEDGMAATILYGTLGEALAEGAVRPAEVQGGLFIQTADDVVSYLSLVEG